MQNGVIQFELQDPSGVRYVQKAVLDHKTHGPVNLSDMFYAFNKFVEFCGYEKPEDFAKYMDSESPTVESDYEYISDYFFEEEEYM